MEEKRNISERELIELIQREEKVLQTKQKYFSNTQNLLADTIKTIETLKEIENKPDKIYFMAGSGVMIEAKITNTKKVKRIFSEKGYLEENTKDTIKWLKKRKKNIDEQLKKILEDIKKNEKNLNNMINIARKIEEEKQKLNSKNIATK